jgi:ABC-type nitrate/sulfonate/bicarbonate transport system substrate-binding protein
MTEPNGDVHLAGAAGLANATVRVATGLRAASQCIAWIGEQAGIFRKHGLSLIFPQLEVGGPASVAGLMRGDWDFAQTGVVPIAEAVLNGGDPVILLRNTVPHDPIVIMAKPAIASLDQLAGKRVGTLTDAYSGQAGVIARLTIERAGARASFVGLGTYGSIYAALAAGAIDAAVLPVDFRFLAGDRRWNTFETASLQVPSILATTRRKIAADRDLVVRMVRGFVEAIHLFKSRPGVVAPLLQDFLDVDDAGAVERLHAYYAPLLPTVPRPDLTSGMQGLRDLFAKRYPSAHMLQETDIADSSVIEEVEQSGLVSRLYR